MTVHLVAHWTAIDGSETVVADLAAQLVEHSRNEIGCDDYQVFQNLERPTEFVLVETYTDRDALDTHRTSDHFGRLVTDQIADRLRVRDVTEFSQIGPPR